MRGKRNISVYMFIKTVPSILKEFEVTYHENNEERFRKAMVCHVIT